MAVTISENRNVAPKTYEAFGHPFDPLFLMRLGLKDNHSWVLTKSKMNSVNSEQACPNARTAGCPWPWLEKTGGQAGPSKLGAPSAKPLAPVWRNGKRAAETWSESGRGSENIPLNKLILWRHKLCAAGTLCKVIYTIVSANPWCGMLDATLLHYLQSCEHTCFLRQNPQTTNTGLVRRKCILFTSWQREYVICENLS